MSEPVDPEALPPGAAAATVPAPKFKLGDVVHLKSGGQHMTVGKIRWLDEAKVWVCDCDWHDAQAVPRSFGYHEDQLQSSYPAGAAAVGVQAGTYQGEPSAAENWRDKHGLRR